MTEKKLRLGLLLDSFIVSAWVNATIRQIAKVDSGEIVLVILNGRAGNPKRTNWKKIIYTIYSQIDEKFFTKKPDPFALKDTRELLSNIPVIEIIPKQNGESFFLKDSDVEAIRNYQLDVLIKFGFDGLQLDDLNASIYGTWYYFHGDDRIKWAGPPGFWEAVEHWPETGSALIATGGRLAPHRVLFRSYFVTYPLSPARHRSYYFWATTSFLPRQIELLYRLGEKAFWQETERFNIEPLTQVRKHELPSNFATLGAVARISARLIKETAQRAFTINQWFLLFSLKGDVTDGVAKFTKLQPPKGTFWADPHVVQENGKYYIFIEEFLDVKNKGHLSVIEMDEDGHWKSPIKIVDKEYHLSYPFVFEWNEKYYMVPESRANRSIDLYECIEFPDTWIFKQSLMENVSAVDTTLTHYRNKWWLFTAISENEAAVPNVELFLYYRDDLFSGEWNPHAGNPIISDVKSARPAGSLFAKNGKLFRPSQNCSRAYGYGFDLNEIEALSETEYIEKRVVSIRPNWDREILATHTYAKCGNLTIIDALKRIPKIG